MNKIEQLEQLIEKEQYALEELSNQQKRVNDQIAYHQDKIKHFKEQLAWFKSRNQAFVDEETNRN